MKHSELYCCDLTNGKKIPSCAMFNAGRTRCNETKFPSQHDEEEDRNTL